MMLSVVALYAILFLSGFAGLGYEVVWTRMFALGLGHEIVAVLSVVSAFFCGLSAGSWRLERWALSRVHPGLVYAALEGIISLWSLALIIIIPLSNGFMVQAMGPEPSALLHWTVSFLFPFCILFPATFAMGGTLPAMKRFLIAVGYVGKTIGGLYAANTFGAVAGTLLSTFLILPQLGFRETLLAFASINLACAAGAILLTRGFRTPAPENPKLGSKVKSANPSRLAITLFATGFLGIGYETLVIRLLSQVMEDTVYSFASALMVYLFGTACGAAFYQRFKPGKGFREVSAILLAVLAFCCLASTILLYASQGIYSALQEELGMGMIRNIIIEILLTATVFLIPTTAMGAVFSHLAQESTDHDLGLGRALSINTLGAAFAPLVIGVIFLPLLGAKTILIMISLGYLLLIPCTGKQRFRLVWAPLALGLMVFFIHSPLRLVTLDPGDELIDYREGVMASVAVVRDPRHEIHLKVNNRFQMGGTSSVYSDRRQGHIPLLLHPNPGTALFLGMGTGATLAATLDHPELRSEGVELIPEVIPLLHHFKRSIGEITNQPRVKMMIADARRYVSATPNSYDVIVADLFHPARDGAGSLYTLEHFTAIRHRLKSGGIFCQWLPLYQLDLETLRIITRTFLEVFPEGSAFLAHYSLKAPIIGLIAGAEGRFYSAHWLEDRMKDTHLAQKLSELRLDTDFNLLGCFLAGSADLKHFAGHGPLNTDDRPLVTYQAPRFTYSAPEPAYTRLLALLDNFHPEPTQVLVPPQRAEDAEWRRRLADYWAARNQFLRIGVGIQETDNVAQLVSQVRDPLLAVVRQSRDFDAAYNPLLAMARQLSRTDPVTANQLLVDLKKANPYRAEAQ